MTDQLDLSDAESAQESVVGTKWHKHTITVYQLFAKALQGGDNDRVSLAQVSAGCTKATAARLFYECLQLKTWGFLELEQEGPYADLLVRN
jgi:Conserved region of Rad21 / Rec8 like protein